MLKIKLIFDLSYETLYIFYHCTVYFLSLQHSVPVMLRDTNRALTSLFPGPAFFLRSFPSCVASWCSGTFLTVFKTAKTTSHGDNSSISHSMNGNKTLMRKSVDQVKRSIYPLPRF